GARRQVAAALSDRTTKVRRQGGVECAEGNAVLDGVPTLPYLRRRETSPHREAAIWKGRSNGDQARGAASRAAFFIWPLRKAPWLGSAKSQRRSARPLASRQGRQGQAQARH